MTIARSTIVRFASLYLRLAKFVLKQAKTLSRLTLLDPLTGIFNRNALLPRLNHEISRSIRYKRPLSLAIIDIDHFKMINDTLGHPAGDAALKNLSDVMTRLVRSADIVIRYGGDEFIILFPETPVEMAQVPLERLRRKIENESGSFDLCGGIRKFTLSIGVAQLPIDSGTTSPEEFIKMADEALYKAKDNGRNRIEVYSE